MVNALLTWWRWRPFPWRRWDLVTVVEYADEVPDEIAPMTAVMVGTESSPKWLAFDCPCKRHHRVLISISPSRHPRWSVLTKTPLHVIPSVDEVSDGIRCHYFIHGGQVQWVRDRKRRTR